LRESFIKHFPQLSELRFEFQWGGAIASTTRLTPFFGNIHNGQTLYALGYTGHGIGSTRVAAKILAHQALNRSNPLLSLSMVIKKPFPYPPEPIRRIAVGQVTNALRRLDQGSRPGLLLKILDWIGIGFSS
jgi:glycine/D-amino acid oxidase-like deaminating enzyme